MKKKKEKRVPFFIGVVDTRSVADDADNRGGH